jgi:hypothetical protein
MKVEMKRIGMKGMKNREVHCVALVVTIMVQMSSGFVAMCVNAGSMASVSRSHQPGLSISSNTSALIVVQKGPVGFSRWGHGRWIF